jgi:sensor c-di-GMP phosphodiesterase-like protein
MASRKQRFLITLAATTSAALCGTLAGYQLATAIAVRYAEGRLDRYATRLVEDGEASSAELRTVLAAVAVSRHHTCSADEIGYFRALIFESEFLMDAGLMRDGNIECSAALGKLTPPKGQFQADFTQQDGTAIYEDLAPYRKPDLTVLAMRSGDSYVVFTPFTRMHLEPLPMHYIETVTDAPSQKTGRLLGESLQASQEILSKEGQYRKGETLLATRCSIRFFSCVTTFTSISEIIAVNRARFNGCVLMCCFLGALFGLVSPLLYRRNKNIEQQLRRAIRNDKLKIVYQPVVDLRSKRIVGAEALARWTNEDGVPVGPDVFVRIAEQCGFVGEITKLVLRHVLHDCGAMLRKRPEIHVSINVAAADLADPEFLLMLDRNLYREGVSSHSIAIEITEGSTARSETAIKTIHSLRQRGHSVHIDDFGTGYSSLSYLHELSIDAIKIDKAFTQAIGTESVVVTILPQILSMAEALELEVVVEGIETPVQAGYFTAFAQPIFGQGWLFGRPASADEFIRRLSENDIKELRPAEAA